MKTRNGKIARLPKPIREQLNQRLENGEPGTSLVAWLNQLPEVQKIITDQFDGLPIRPQNLSEWRKGGYIDWIRHQLLREQTRWTAEQATELGLDAAGATISIAEDIATVMSAELAIHVQALGDIKSPTQRFNQFRKLSLELSRLRRDDHRTIRQLLRRKKQQSTPTPTVGQDSAEPKPLESEEPTQPATAPGGSSERPSVPDCGSPLPLSTPPALKAEPPVVDEIASPTSSFCIQPSSFPENSPLPLSETLSTPPAPKPEPPVAAETAFPMPSFYTHPPSLPAAPTSQPSAPIRVNPSNNYYDPRPPRRGRRFVCIEG